MLTDLQTKKFIHLFNTIDANHDGRIDRSDYEHCTESLAAARGWAPGSPEHKALEARQMGVWGQLESQLPKEAHGKLDQGMWLAFHDMLVGNKAAFDQAVMSSAEFFFGILDADGDNRISVDEYRIFLRAYQIKEGPWVEPTFRACDLNGDGYITKDEMLKLTQEFYYSGDPAAPGNHFFGPF